LAQLPANKLDADMVKTRKLADTNFISSPFFNKLMFEKM
jgi:hypothetical protein